PVEGSSAGLGVKVAVSPSAETVIVPGTGMPVAWGKTMKSAVLTVNGSTRLLNCSWITLLVGTPPAPFAGLTVVTTGVVLSATAPVVKAKVAGFGWGVSAPTVY